ELDALETPRAGNVRETLELVRAINRIVPVARIGGGLEEGVARAFQLGVEEVRGEQPGRLEVIFKLRVDLLRALGREVRIRNGHDLIRLVDRPGAGDLAEVRSLDRFTIAKFHIEVAVESIFGGRARQIIMISAVALRKPLGIF